MIVSLEIIKEHFPTLKRFIARLKEEDIQYMIDNIEIDKDDIIYEKVKPFYSAKYVYEGFSKVWTIVAFGEAINKYDVDLSPIEFLCINYWLGCLYESDIEILIDRLNMIEDLDYLDSILFKFYLILDEAIELYGEVIL